jgi:hypothetical protein
LSLLITNDSRSRKTCDADLRYVSFATGRTLSWMKGKLIAMKRTLVILFSGTFWFSQNHEMWGFFILNKRAFLCCFYYFSPFSIGIPSKF